MQKKRTTKMADVQWSPKIARMSVSSDEGQGIETDNEESSFSSEEEGTEGYTYDFE